VGLSLFGGENEKWDIGDGGFWCFGGLFLAVSLWFWWCENHDPKPKRRGLNMILKNCDYSVFHPNH
jgi:hypothetical protein